MKGGKRYRIVMDPARWGKRTGPRVLLKEPTGVRGSQPLLAEANPTAELGGGHAAPPSKYNHKLLDWDAIADLFIKDAEAKRKGGTNNGER